MEKDIEILESFIKQLEELKYAIENLINRVKELENEVEKQKEIIKKYENYTRLRSVVDFYNNNPKNDFISKDKIKEKIEELEKEQEQNRKELARGLDYLSNKMIDSASNKIVINMSIREYLQDLLK